jgi:hypothetical protein
MTVGLVTVSYVNKILDHMHRAVASTAPAGNFVKLHTADPGAAATTAPSSVTTRPALTFSAASAGVVTAIATFPSWTAWAGTNGEVVTHISVWDAATVGTFLCSAVLTVAKTVNTGDTLTLSSFSVAVTPLAA